MRVIHGYVLRLFFKYFGMVLGMVVVIYLSIDFFGRIDNFMADSLSSSEILAYFLYKTPLIISQITPAALLLGVLIVFGLMSKNNEIVALKSGGISMYYIIAPVLIIGLCMSVLLFFFTEAIVPVTNARSNRIAENKKQDKKMVTSTEKNIWIRGNQSVTHISFYDPSRHAIFGITLTYMDDNFFLTRRIDARQGVFKDGKWILTDCMIQEFDPSSDHIEEVFQESMVMDLNLLPEDLKKVEQEAEEMSFGALLSYVRKVEKEGYDATKYRVDLYAKTAFPFVCLIMSIFGSGIALRGRTREGMIVSFAYGIGTAFCYWALYSFCLSLGYGDMIPPVAAAWMTNVLFFCSAGLMMLSLE